MLLTHNNAPPMEDVSKCYALNEPITETEVDRLFDYPNYWKSTDYLIQKLGEFRDLEYQNLSLDFRRSLSCVLEKSVDRGILESSSHRNLSKVQASWARESNAESKDPSKKFFSTYYRIKP